MNLALTAFRGRYGDLPIKLKILAGFLVVLLVLAGVAGFGLAAFSRVAVSFTAFRQQADLMDTARQIERDFVDLRRLAVAFELDSTTDAAGAIGVVTGTWHPDGPDAPPTRGWLATVHQRQG